MSGTMLRLAISASPGLLTTRRLLRWRGLFSVPPLKRQRLPMGLSGRLVMMMQEERGRGRGCQVESTGLEKRRCIFPTIKKMTTSNSRAQTS